ncbi:hypothetical protein IFM89_030402 [Coptis chinensis]|uniref:Uncharacterized protein n=1 Tax=Coptis chinensis TaxID=261450 RepID=A0A835LSY1_9MAGN|nr:hypothetical protein IFM89_030402 [Coptis chinensis]
MVKRRREDPNGDENGGKWVRGTSTLPKVFNNPSSSKLKLTWNGNNQPDGPDTHPSLFAESIGVLMTSSHRFDWTKYWEQQGGDDKLWLWNTLKDSWELDESKKETTLGRIASDEFRNKKTKWKKNFYSRYTTYEERIAHKPEHLSQQEWVNLVQLWDSPEHQRNKRNRSKQIAKHTSGRKGFPEMRAQIIREEGAPPSQGDFFVLSHTSRKTNDALDGQSREYMEKMKELAGRDENGNQQPLSDEIYRQVMPRERHGRVRLMGRGVTPTSYFGSQASSHGTTSDRVAELENEMAEMRRVAQEKEEERQRLETPVEPMLESSARC